MTDPRYREAVRVVLDNAGQDVEESIKANLPDVVLAERIGARVRSLVTAERAFCECAEKTP